MYLFEAVKDGVTARAAAELYGLKVNRNGMACCPFHKDRTPSMKLDERYYCFSCQATGDAVDLTMRLLGLGAKDAALRLADDFGISVPNTRGFRKKRIVPQTRPRADPQKEAEVWINHAVKILIEYRWLLREWEKEYAPQSMDEEWNDLFCEALGRKDYVDYLLDELMLCSKDQFRDMKISCGKEVDQIEQRLVEAHAAENEETHITGDETACAGVECSG